MAEKLEKGKKGEEYALDFLQKQGFELKLKNFTSRNSEIDLIVSKGNLLVFVEVRLKATSEYGYPEKTMGKAKINAIKRGAEEYLERFPWEGEARFDMISIVEFPEFELIHFVDAFY